MAPSALRGLPPELPEGASVADLPLDEIRERAEVLVQMFETMCERLHAFVAADCPSSESQRLQQLWTSCLHYYARAFRGAQEWRDGCEGVVAIAIAAGALRATPEDVPPIVTAAAWCDLALAAEEAFFAAIRQHEGVLERL